MKRRYIESMHLYLLLFYCVIVIGLHIHFEPELNTINKMKINSTVHAVSITVSTDPGKLKRSGNLIG